MPQHSERRVTGPDVLFDCDSILPALPAHCCGSMLLFAAQMGQQTPSLGSAVIHPHTQRQLTPAIPPFTSTFVMNPQCSSLILLMLEQLKRQT